MSLYFESVLQTVGSLGVKHSKRNDPELSGIPEHKSQPALPAGKARPFPKRNGVKSNTDTELTAAVDPPGKFFIGVMPVRAGETHFRGSLLEWPWLTGAHKNTAVVKL